MNYKKQSLSSLVHGASKPAIALLKKMLKISALVRSSAKDLLSDTTFINLLPIPKKPTRIQESPTKIKFQEIKETKVV